MGYHKKCISTGDYQYVATGEPAPGDIVVQWWEAELARKDKRIAELEKEAGSAYKQGYDDGHSKGFMEGYNEKDQELK